MFRDFIVSILFFDYTLCSVLYIVPMKEGKYFQCPATTIQNSLSSLIIVRRDCLKMSYKHTIGNR